MRTTNQSHIITAAVAAFALCALTAAPALAQSDNPFTGRAFFGADSPSGGIKDHYDAGGFGGVQVGYRLKSYLGLVATSTWANAPTYRAGRLPDNATAWTLDAGVEARTAKLSRSMGSWAIEPYVGAGAGERSYLLAKTLTTSTTSPVGYGALGADLNRGNSIWGLRLEARDYFGSFNDPERIQPKQSGSDLGVALGVSIR